MLRAVSIHPFALAFSDMASLFTLDGAAEVRRTLTRYRRPALAHAARERARRELRLAQ